MGAVVYFSMVAAIPACAIAAVLWGRITSALSPEENAKRIASAAHWTALALTFQAVSLLATAYAVLAG
jgi:hypothetical protein